MNIVKIIRIAASLSFVLASIALVGCERKEELLDIETPGGEVEVDRNVDTGELDVEVTDD